MITGTNQTKIKYKNQKRKNNKSFSLTSSLEESHHTSVQKHVLDEINKKRIETDEK